MPVVVPDTPLGQILLIVASEYWMLENLAALMFMLLL
jgi:hypothetical protein